MYIGKINRHNIVDTFFTSVLQHIDSPPEALYSIGTIPPRAPSIAIVGSRRPTPYGLEVTRMFAKALAERGVTIISGLALGVDAAAHQAALEAGGTTVAVMANGLHRIYPASHTGLARSIVQKGGALLSEKPPGEEARRYDFLARNRLISGLADAVLVTEATDKSGTLSTVAHALAQNKDVFAVPGPITSLLSAGANRLLQQGAQVAMTPEDILSIIAPETLHTATQTVLPLGDTPLETRIITALQQGSRTGEELHAISQANASEFAQALTMLELKGSVKALGANRWSL